MPDRVELHTRSEAATRRAARRLAGALHGGERIALSGDLGAGKTTFVRGLAAGLGIPAADVRSPSFPILIPHESGRLPLYHLDLFRLAAGDIDSLGLREYIYGSGVCAIEWPDRLPEPLGDHLAIRLELEPDGSRRLVAEAHGASYKPLLEVLGATPARDTSNQGT
ncbi:MAG: tRNA (adenosine(37)-N6)-threonylcarbamoyltransferase complex ATPase subunit type 1 TsaE [Deltaproteobacteria bacterium]|nr:tRNA (adenosine(37)-N6)-threonylcarbamoyltransferase complex ATPase subunit type 1 TsaE [Deltaproteobacteria bacterium]